MNTDPSHIRDVIKQHLRTDQLLGIRSIPIAWPIVNSPAPSNDASGNTECNTTGDTAAGTAGKPTGDADAKRIALRELDEAQVRGCTRCELCKTRTKTVFGQGNPSARIVFVGEAPGFEEDRQGLAFVGRAGELLTKIITAMGLSRDDVFICNVLKCRPPNNRDPSADEILACSPYLRRQIAIIDPEVMVALGAPAAKTLLKTAQSIGKLRGRFHEYHMTDGIGGGPSIPLMPTYHPAYLLRNPAEKKKTWDDIQQVMTRLGLTPPARTGA